MSKDSSFTHVHLHASHHADLFEEFCHPPSLSSTSATSTTASHNISAASHHHHHHQGASADPSDPSLTHIPGHFLPFESINLPAHLMPINPEDEDGVVPDMHAAFGIVRAMGQSGAPDQRGEQSGRGWNTNLRGEEAWRDFGLEDLVRGVEGVNIADGRGGGGNVGVTLGRVNGGATVSGARREGRRHGILSVR